MADPTPEPLDDATRRLLRHTLATLAYRAGKVLRDAPEGFAAFRAAPASRSAIEILCHMGDLMGWAERLARGEFDLVAVGRALLQDPEWVLKGKQNRLEELRDYNAAALATYF